MEKGARISLMLLIILSLIIISFLIAGTVAESSGSSNGANLTIWDDTDSGTKLTFCSEYCSIKGKGTNNWNDYFYANYTNETTGNPISDGNCTVRFNETGTWTNWENMSYNSTYERFQYNSSFNYKGTLYFEVNCTNLSSSQINITDNISVTNTAPWVFKDATGYIDFNPPSSGVGGESDTLQCTEDTLCTYNLSANVSEDDYNDVLTYSYGGGNTTLVNGTYTLNSSTGILEINVTNDTNAGIGKKIELNARDSNDVSDTGILEVDITAVNDAPVFVSLQNQSFNISELFEDIISITDEENNIPFSLNISFINCSVAEWSTRNCSNSSGRELFNSSQYSFNGTSGILNISFTPVRNDVGSYIINFTVTDLNNDVTPYNASTSQIVNFTVLNINSAPYFTYVCDNERNTTEDSEFTCWINATDIDETNNLTFIANYSWFTFNETGSNSTTVNCNISTSYNASAMVNFTPTDTEVGNWSVNITITDTGSPVRENSTVFWFFIDNTEDGVGLDFIDNETIYENKTIYVNATDDDLLVPDKNVKDEGLTFASNTSWVSISEDLAPSGVNYIQAKIEIDFDSAPSYGNHTIRVNVTDTVGNTAERNFTIQVLGDNAPEWNETMADVFVIYENNLTYMNFSENVTDAEGDTISFSFTNDTSFPSFSLNLTTGIINFTPTDEDIGYHNVTISATDGMLNSLKSFNFTILNVNDVPYIETPLQVNSNITINTTNSNINTTEDSLAKIYLFIQDNDFKIPSNQKDFYNESLNVSVNITGPNSTLFEFVYMGFVTLENRTQYTATFTPGKSDVGSYNITINVSDVSNSSDILEFNLTITEIDHAPVLMNLTNQTSTINRSFYYRINATDIEDGNSMTSGNTNFTFTYNFTSGNDILNSTTFNSTTGEINITFNSSDGGKYRINITVNDSSGNEDSADFWLFVYGSPNITFPAEGQNFSLQENITSNLTFKANHDVEDNLTYEFYIDNILKYNISYYGNNTNLTWRFAPNYTDETYGEVRNLTLIVLNPYFNNLNASISWNITINHTNAPVVFSGYIGDTQADYNNDITIELDDYFSDIDYSDSHYNQTINFSVFSNATPTNIQVSVSSDWILTLSVIVEGVTTELLTINASDLNDSALTNATSNSFEIRFTTPTTTPVPIPSSGGSGKKPIALKIIIPDPVSAYKKDRIIIPIILSNEGKFNLYKINLTAIVAKNMTIREDINLFFDKSYFPSLLRGEKENVTLIIDINTNETGLYEITINATVKSPKYTDWGKFYLTVKEANKTEVLEELIFTEEFIAENPECIEIKEIVNEAKEYFEMGDYTAAFEKAREAVDACRYAIAQPALPRRKERFENKLYKYLSLSTLIVFAIGILYYTYRKMKFKKTSTS